MDFMVQRELSPHKSHDPTFIGFIYEHVYSRSVFYYF